MEKILFILLVAIFWSAAEAKIIRPCKFHDYKCIGDNLAANSQCNKKVGGRLPNEYTVDHYNFETPYFNSSYIDNNLIVRNHGKCFVSEFFINTHTKKAVLSIDCPYLGLESDRVLIKHTSKQEDSYYHYHISSVYPLIRITVNLPSSTHMNLCKAHVFTEVAALPLFDIAPQDKPTKGYLSKDLTALSIFEQEAFYFHGDRLSKAFIDEMLCDYGCLRDILPHHRMD